MMSTETKKPALRVGLDCAKHFAKIYSYPCGLMDIVASSKPDFGVAGWEAAEDYSKPGKPAPSEEHSRKTDDPRGEDIARSMRRARAKVRRIALSNDFKWFVTLTLDAQKIDRYDCREVIKTLNQWCSNAVQRQGLRYILVPERHEDGAIHFHGFFNDCLEAVDSGTIKPPGGGRPRKPRSKAQREEWLRNGGKIVYNLPRWTYGFTTAIELYGEYPAAVAYVCKYIGKEGEKPGGRWYYSGGELSEPRVAFAEISPAELVEDYGGKAFVLYPPGKQIAVVNGIKGGYYD